jgi:hypothetical protein
MFNLVRKICAAVGTPFVSAHRDSSANLPWGGPGSPLMIAKTHCPMTDYEELLAQSGDPVVITVRDPCDAVVSLMERFPSKGFDEALKDVAYSAERLLTVADGLHDAPVFRYEDGFVGAVETFDQVAGMLGVAPGAESRATILAELSSDAVRETIGQLEAAGVIRGEAVWDMETHWHAGHVGDGRIGKWRGALTNDQARQVLERTRAYRHRFGYSEDGSLGAETSGLIAEQTAGP